jgi:hypothetical protein
MQPALPSKLSTAGLLIDIVPTAAAILVGLTGLCGSVAHYCAILLRLPRRDVERFTGAGFFFGLIAAAIVLLIEALS